MEKKRGTNWTEAERHAALSSIICHHDELFSKFKGASFGHKSKEAKWAAVLNEINSCSGTPRTVEEIKKMYQNSKQRAKEKYFKSKKTGGGPAEKFSACENILLEKLKDTNVLSGIDGGVESGVMSHCDSIENVPECSQTQPDGVGVVQDFTISNPSVMMSRDQMLPPFVVTTKPSPSSSQSAYVETVRGKSRKRLNEMAVDELYELEKKRAEVDLQLARNRLAHEDAIFDLKSAILQKTLEQIMGNNSGIPFNEL